MKIHICSKLISADKRSKFYSPTLVMVTSSYDWYILEQKTNGCTNNQTNKKLYHDISPCYDGTVFVKTSAESSNNNACEYREIWVNCIIMKQKIVWISHRALRLDSNYGCRKNENTTKTKDQSTVFSCITLAKTSYWFSTKLVSRIHETSTETRL